MAENADGQEKSEEPTKKKLDDARMRGQVAKSVDTTTAALLLIGGLSVYYYGTLVTTELQDFSVMIFRKSGMLNLTEQAIIDYGRQLLYFFALLLMPIAGLLFIVALGAEFGQVGFKLASKKFTEGVDFKRVFNPFKGLKNILFSSRTVAELVKSVLKMVIIGFVMYTVLADEMETIVSVMTMPFKAIGPYMAELSFELTWKVAVVYIVIAMADFYFQKWKFKDDMKMTKQEVREEGKQLEGDMKAKQRMRQIGRQRLQKVMLQRVKEADVVITNPTHFAVALKYDPVHMDAPKVVAKGQDFIALKIREIAQQEAIPIIEDKPLARSLFKLVDIDQFIPENLFQAVAQILAHVFRTRGDKAPQTAQTSVGMQQ